MIVSIDRTLFSNNRHAVYIRLYLHRWRYSFLFSLIFGIPVFAIRVLFMTAFMTPSHEVTINGTIADVSTTAVTIMVIPGLSLENLLLFIFCTLCQVCSGKKTSKKRDELW